MHSKEEKLHKVLSPTECVCIVKTIRLKERERHFEIPWKSKTAVTVMGCLSHPNQIENVRKDAAHDSHL